MSVMNDIMQACATYSHHTNEQPMVVVVPVERGRLLVDEVIDSMGSVVNLALLSKLREAQEEQDDVKFASMVTGMNFSGVRLIVLADQMVLGGWVVEQPDVVRRLLN